MLLKNAIEEAPKMKSVSVNFESSSSVQATCSDKQVQRPNSITNRLTRRKMPLPHSDSPSQDMLDHAESQSDGQNVGTSMLEKSSYLVAPKRARSPLISVEKSIHSSSVVSDSEREMQAKAKRLARFKTELTQPLQNLQDISWHKSSENRQKQVPLVQQKTDEHAEDASYGGNFPDHEGVESSKAVIGLCPEMCPDLERDERERKGDLDQYERLNGDRNRTNKFLAVKKYNRMAEREAELIRPLSVLQKTVDYLLSLLDQPYDGSFLNIYNFLWDRMRAVRMDLRMQHIFNEDAILMLEQMIRLHVIAMHELCEFEKGEGFTEGFDAHLNIEQMNKASVELFQLYDDHRKRGKSFASEKEFRGYYALLKLDKHPGYKVEPVELSLDLAKMTPEIRSTKEILFARDVASACRIGNYIAFFRLARKATYLQSCLMHAHFSKLRKQALASLHSGLQNNQGIPIAHVEKWLAMEGEDVEGLLEYHGFSIKKYEEAYMVKEGPFLSTDVDFPTRCAQLVQHKRSEKIVDDVRTASILEELYVERECGDNIVDIFDHENSVNAESHATAYDEKMLDNNICYSPKVLTKPSSLFEERLPFIENRGIEMKTEEMPAMRTTFMPPVENVGKYGQQYDNQQIIHRYDETFFNEVTLQVLESSKIQPPVHQSSSSSMIDRNSTSKMSESEELESETLLPLFDQEEAKKKTLKLILRKWKKRAAMRRANRELKEFLASEALSSLSLGPPIGQIQYQQSRSYKLPDIDAISNARHGKIVNSWSRLNISDLVAPIMVARNPSIRFICWKLILLVQPSDPDNQTHQLALDWLFFKLLGKEHDAELVVCSSGLSIWKKWSDPYGSSPQTCCLSIIREKILDGSHTIEGDVLHGASCLAYLVSETIPWEIQRARLQNVLVSVPAGSSLPLLILSTDSPKGEYAERSVNITRRLSLQDEKEMRISSSFVTFLSDSSLKNLPGFFDDNQLRAGLQWLANNVPTLPSLCLVKTREVVLNYLKRCMEVTANHKGFDIAPNDCIDGFNKALDKSAEEIMVTASMNPTQWPAPEIDLLDNSSNEGRMAGLYLPSTSWNSPTRIDQIIRAIKSCKLPSFPDTAWLKHESLTGVQLKQQKLALEEILMNYLHESNKLLNADLAVREAGVMLQKCVGLQHCGSGYCLIPRWNLIFQRIYSWQLNKLTAPGISNVYIMDNKDNLLTNDALDSGVEQSSFLYFPTDVSLDELVEKICSNPFEERRIVVRPMPPRSTGGGGDDVKAHEDEDGDSAEAGMSSRNHDDLRCSSSYELVPELMDTNKQIVDLPVFRNDRLATLLKRCNRVQDMIDQKLAIYF
ncbi:SAC3 family protein B isoform X2 [Phalaenopsis equestris]|nr:SAC3 family protein B isoform X2 [Phalaenopsis equestris]